MSPANDAIKALRFVTSKHARVEFAPWGKHWWLSQPGLTGTKLLTLVRVTMYPGAGHQFHHHPDPRGDHLHRGRHRRAVGGS